MPGWHLLGFTMKFRSWLLVLCDLVELGVEVVEGLSDPSLPQHDLDFLA